MSTLKVVGLQNPASGIVNGTLNSDGTSTFNGIVTFASGQTFPTATGTLPPASPSQGSTWYDTGVTPAVFKVWNGSGWFPVANTNSATAPVGTTPSPLVTGQQWINTSTVPPVLNIWNGTAWIPSSVSISNGVAPTSPIVGQLWSDTSTTPATLKAWNGGAWVPVQAAGGGGSGTVTSVTGTLPITVATGTTTPLIAINAATTGAQGAVQIGTNIDVTTGTISVKDASATDKGVIEIATLAEAATGTDATRALTPSTGVPKDAATMTGAALIPGGNDGARPSPVTGMLRYNNQGGTPVEMEYYDGAAWSPVGGVTSVTGTAPLTSSGGTTPAISITPGTARQLMQTNAAGTAAEFASNIDVPGTLDVTGVGTFDADLKFNSGYGSAATAYGCRAWVNFNGVPASPTIRAGGNVSSITKNGTGDYTVNFTTPMVDTSYTLTGTGGNPGTANGFIQCADNLTPRTSSLARFTNVCGAFGTTADGIQLNIAVFR